MMATVYTPELTFNDCGCIAPEEVVVLPNGRAIAYYGSYAPAPYRSLEALLAAHDCGGDMGIDEIREALGEPVSREYTPGQWVEALRLARREYGADATRAGL